MRLTSKEQQQFVSVLRGDKMNSRDNATSEIVSSITLSALSFVIKVIGLIYCIKWGFGVNVTSKEAILGLLIVGLITPIEPNKNNSEILNFCATALARIFLCLVVYLVAYYL